jgi:endonuclease G
MSPQKAAFNRGIWKKLETKVRGWATREGAVLIVTAGVLKPRLKTIGVNKVSVPKLFYKVILDNTEPELKGIGFILPNKGSAKPLSNYAVTIDKVERVTGIDFFHSLADEIEETVESTLDLSKWDFD